MFCFKYLDSFVCANSSLSSSSSNRLLLGVVLVLVRPEGALALAFIPPELVSDVFVAPNHWSCRKKTTKTNRHCMYQYLIRKKLNKRDSVFWMSFTSSSLKRELETALLVCMGEVLDELTFGLDLTAEAKRSCKKEPDSMNKMY